MTASPIMTATASDINVISRNGNHFFSETGKVNTPESEPREMIRMEMIVAIHAVTIQK